MLGGGQNQIVPRGARFDALRKIFKRAAGVLAANFPRTLAYVRVIARSGVARGLGGETNTGRIKAKVLDDAVEVPVHLAGGVAQIVQPERFACFCRECGKVNPQAGELFGW